MKLSDVKGGERDAAPVLQSLLDSGGQVRVPAGHYRVGAPLRVGSGTVLEAEAGAEFVLADGAATRVHDFLLTNANPGNGNRDIVIRGGIWDGNNAGNPRGPDADPYGYSGVTINMANVANLTLHDLTVRNAESFFIRLGEVREFAVEEVRFETDRPRLNNDGVHVGGYSRDGLIRGLRATGAETPNDDMVALNADDDVERQLNRGMRRGPIRNIVIEDVEAEDAYTFLRLLSVDQPIEGVAVRRLRGSCRIHGINLNNWRFPRGVGAIRRVLIEDCELRKSAKPEYAPAIIKISLAVDDLTIRNFRRHPETLPEVETLRIDNQRALTLTRPDGRHAIAGADGFLQAAGDLEYLHLSDG